MFKKQELTRLGDILVSKGLITPEQLDAAIREQSRRKLLLDPLDPNAKVAPIGELLIELGFIDRLQLKRGLNWQQRLRRASIAMALCAPFMIFSPSAAASTARPAVTIEAENYSAMSGVFNEATLDVGGGQNTGNINTGDWMTYNNVSIPVTGTYKISYRVASLETGGTFQLKTGNSVIDTVTVPKTGAWQTWVTVERTVTLTAGIHNLTLAATAGGFNVNWFKIENLTETAASSSASSTPSSAAAPAISPIVVQAENYSSMSGVYNEPTTDEGGGQDTGNINTGDWMTYNGITIPASGTYKITYRVASLSAGGTFQLKTGAGAVLDTATVPVTGGWQTWVNVERTVTLSAGTHNLTLLATAGGFNVNWFKIENVSTSISSSSASSVVSSVASSAASSAANSLAAGGVIIQAENYASMSGVFNEPTTDVGGGQNTGNINTGDWMNYSNTKVRLPFTGKYRVTYRVASLSDGGTLALNEASTNATHQLVTIPKTGGWQNWVNVETVVDLTAGDHYFTLFAKLGGFNVNWFKIEPIGTTMPLTIQAEAYSAMSGIYNEPTTDVGGGQNAGNINTADWMEYKNVEVLIPATASYKITYRVASLSAGGSFTFHEAGGSAVFDTVPVPVTGGWQNWTSVERIVTLPAGKHYFGLKALLGGFNVNWIKIEPVDQSNTLNPPVASSSSSAAATNSSSSSSKAAVSSSSSSTPAVGSSSWSSSSSGSNSSNVSGPVGISWTAPSKRENGDYLDITDVGGYEIRYKKSTDTKYTYITINDAFQDRYDFDYLNGDYVFQIAAFDKNGVYSPFVDIQRL